MTNLSFLAGILIFAFGFPAEIVYKRMFPGTAIGVLFGDLVYTWMAFRLARRTGRRDVTAMPLGLDTPSTFGVVFLILGPSALIAWLARRDLLGVRRKSESYYRAHPPFDDSLERYTHIS